jgi:hypothetical protein
MRGPDGVLQDHRQPCDECTGSGIDYGDRCGTCDGDGSLFWGSWYEADVALCGYCRADDVAIASMYGADNFELQWVCFPCYVRHHAAWQCCDLWREPPSKPRGRR